MIKMVSHKMTGTNPAGIDLALNIAYVLHAPTPRAPEVAPAARKTARRATATAAARGSRRGVRG